MRRLWKKIISINSVGNNGKRKQDRHDSMAGGISRNNSCGGRDARFETRHAEPFIFPWCQATLFLAFRGADRRSARLIPLRRRTRLRGDLIPASRLNRTSGVPTDSGGFVLPRTPWPMPCFPVLRFNPRSPKVTPRPPIDTTAIGKHDLTGRKT